MVERVHPVAPEFRGCPVGRPGAMTPERRAQLLLVYFTPWVVDEKMVKPPHVVHGQQLQPAGEDGQRGSWQDGLQAYLKRGCLSEEICQVMQNFTLVFFVRYPAASGDDASDEEEQDVELQPWGTQGQLRTDVDFGLCTIALVLQGLEGKAEGCLSGCAIEDRAVEAEVGGNLGDGVADEDWRGPAEEGWFDAL